MDHGYFTALEKVKKQTLLAQGSLLLQSWAMLEICLCMPWQLYKGVYISPPRSLMQQHRQIWIQVGNSHPVHS